MIQRYLKGIGELLEHRGSMPSRVGAALAEALRLSEPPQPRPSPPAADQPNTASPAGAPSQPSKRKRDDGEAEALPEALPLPEPSLPDEHVPDERLLLPDERLRLPEPSFPEPSLPDERLLPSDEPRCAPEVLPTVATQFFERLPEVPGTRMPRWRLLASEASQAPQPERPQLRDAAAEDAHLLPLPLPEPELPTELQGLGLSAASSEHWPALLDDLADFESRDREALEAAVLASTNGARECRTLELLEELPYWMARGKLAMRMMRLAPPD